MKNEFDKEQDLPQVADIFHNQDPRLSPRQAEIYRNLEAIGPEIAAFYLSGVKMLQDDAPEASSYFLAQSAREIDGGLRDVLSTDQEKRQIQGRLKKADLGDFSERRGHIASILAALGIDDLGDPLAKKWIGVATQFHEFAHRHGAWEAPRAKEVFVPLWHEFEEVLMDLVGNHFNFLNRIDRLLAYEKPTKEIIRTLPNLLKSEVRYAYFFNKLDTLAWLDPLKEAGWFNPQSSPLVYKVPGQLGGDVTFPWYALVYLEKVANHTMEHPCDETVGTLVEIVNDVVTYANDNQERVMHQSTVWLLVKIISALPTDLLERQHIIFLDQELLRVSQLRLLVENEIEQTFLPKLLNAEAKALTLVFLEVMLNNYRMISIIKKQGPAIVKLCGIEAVHIALDHIQERISQKASSFQIIQPIESCSELLVNFTSSLFRLAEPDSIVETVENLLQKSHTVFKQIALNAIKHHYSSLKQYFWKWTGNPLEETLLIPELYQLFQTNCQAFDEAEIEQILQWIESKQDNREFAEDDETRSKQEAYRKREWLSALVETENKKVISAYQKYEKINPAKIEHPGLLIWTKALKGRTSPTTIEELAGMSNAQIATLLNDFKEKGVSGSSVSTEEGLAETLEEYVALNPQRFANDLHPFQSVRNFYQYWILRGFLKSWRDKKEFDWAKLLEFIHQLISSEQFWTEHHETYYSRSEWIFAAAELIEVGTRDGEYAFDVQLLPLAEKILLILVEKVELRPSTIQDLPTAVVNSDRGRVFLAMMNYALRVAHINEDGQQRQLPKAIKEDFTKRLDRSVEPSFEFSFVLGACLPNLLYFDKEWVTININRIFPEQDAYYWHVTFSGYLLYSGQLHESVYSVLKKHGHYQKAITSDFCSRQIDATVLPRTPVVYLDSQQIDVTVDRIIREKLVSDIYLGWVEGFETLADETSLIYQLVNSENPNLLSTLIHSFWKKRDDLPEEMRVRVIPTWRALYESLSQKEDIGKYEAVLSKLSGWVALVDKIDGEVLKWLKMSTQYIKGLTDSAFFVEELLPHATKTPAEVGDIYLGMLMHNVYPYHDQEYIQEIIRALYRTGYTEVADRICNLYGAAGFDFLRALYDEHQK